METATKEYGTTLTIVKDPITLMDWVEEIEDTGTIPIEDVICDVFDIDKDRLFENTRLSPIKNARFAYYYVMVRWFKYPLKAMERITGWNYASVLHATRKAQNFIDTERLYSSNMEMVWDIISKSIIKVPVDPLGGVDGYKLIYKGRRYIHSTDINDGAEA